MSSPLDQTQTNAIVAGAVLHTTSRDPSWQPGLGPMHGNATQLEYRLALPWRLGLVGFGGVGGVVPGADQFRFKQLLPAGGTGIRCM